MDYFTVAEQEKLGTRRRLALSRYKDETAGFSLAHEVVFNVECPQCHMFSGTLNEVDPTAFRVQRPIETVRADGYAWVIAECSKCDFRFRVIVHRIGEAR